MNTDRGSSSSPISLLLSPRTLHGACSRRPPSMTPPPLLPCSSYLPRGPAPPTARPFPRSPEARSDPCAAAPSFPRSPEASLTAPSLSLSLSSSPCLLLLSLFLPPQLPAPLRSPPLESSPPVPLLSSNPSAPPPRLAGDPPTWRRIAPGLPHRRWREVVAVADVVVIGDVVDGDVPRP